MWHLREHAHPVLTDEGGAILDERTGRWTQLSPTAAAAVLILLSGTTMQQAAERFADLYRIGIDQATVDVRTVADALTSKGLAQSNPAQRPRPWWRWSR